MSDTTKRELEELANQIDEIADGLSSTNMLRARQLRQCVKTLVQIARNFPRETALEGRDGK